ncbi:MAG: cache domain-containing protein [Chthoniobacteraceae bacterium]
MLVNGWVSSITRGLRFRLVVLVMLALAPAIGLQIYSVSSDREAEAKWMRLDAWRRAQLVSSSLGQNVEGARKLVTTIALLPQLQARDYAACNAILHSLLPKNPDYTNLGVMDLNGTWIAAALDAPANTKVRAEEPWFQRIVRQGSFSVSPYQIGRVTHLPLIRFGCPVFDSQGKICAVAFASFRLSMLEKMLSTIDLPDHAAAMVLDQNGLILSHYPDNRQWMVKDLSQTDLFNTISHQQSGVIEATDAGGKMQIYAFTSVLPASDNTMYAVVSLPQEESVGPFNAAIDRSIIALVIGALLSVAAAWHGSESFVLRQLSALRRAAARLASGDFKARSSAPRGIAEVDQLSETFDEMARQMEARELERDEALAALRASEDQQRALSAHLHTVREEESRRIARELHDELGQVLAALKIEMQNLYVTTQSDPDTTKRLSALGTLANETIARVRKLCTELRPGILDELGAVAALQWLAEDFENRTSVPCTFICRNPQLALPPDQATTLFRICQEALTNVMRHAEASSVTIDLSTSLDHLTLRIRDDGRGFDSTTVQPGRTFGIMGMRERASLVGGHFFLKSTPAHGTVVAVSFPFKGDFSSPGPSPHDPRERTMAS